ncbi:Gpr1 family protein [Sistotremastrum niveocremeum HHB9708]|uniref:Gpr1 family protein n=1 Tax=Sistotremastrum niveocremeum HHB9708 TaxID=1314777 RepID=A0A164SQM7_9AGAM|nr:Gpr1 family protein [Sistotremastrum niveocremeum HHB9708]
MAIQGPGHRKFGNPGPLGLISFASTTLILSLVNVNARGVKEPNIVIGMALGVGGLAQLLAGMWEFACGNTFGATAFSSYGGFWFAYASVLIPGTGILDAYNGTTDLDNALGFFLLAWFIFTFIMLMASLRSNLGLVFLFFFLDLTFMFLMIGSFLPAKVNITKAGGGFGIVTAFIAYYVGASELIPREAGYFTLPVYQLPRRD